MLAYGQEQLTWSKKFELFLKGMSGIHSSAELKLLAQNLEISCFVQIKLAALGAQKTVEQVVSRAPLDSFTIF